MREAALLEIREGFRALLEALVVVGDDLPLRLLVGAVGSTGRRGCGRWSASEARGRRRDSSGKNSERRTSTAWRKLTPSLFITQSIAVPPV